MIVVKHIMLFPNMGKLAPFSFLKPHLEKKLSNIVP
jgi:hypothetical protein